MSKTLEASEPRVHTLQQLAAEIEIISASVWRSGRSARSERGLKRNGDKPLIPLADLKSTSISTESPQLASQWLEDREF